MSETTKNYDELFKTLFSNRKIFLMFIKDFIEESWVSDIKENDLYLESSLFVDVFDRGRENDILYRITLGKEEVFVFLLLEHQHKVDYLMPFRILEYMVKLWRRYIDNVNAQKRPRKNFLLPAIYPVVFYDGNAEWTAELEFKKKVNRYTLFGKRIPNFEYLLVDLNKIDFTELQSKKDIVSAVLSVDKVHSDKELAEVIGFGKQYWKEVIHSLKDKAVLFTIAQIIEQLLTKVDIDIEEVKPIIENIKSMEVDKMLAMETNIPKIINSKTKRAFEDGIKKGEIIGKIAMIRDLYEYKYENYEEISKYISEINSLDELQKIFKIILKSQNKQEILDYLEKSSNSD